jgi:hypothetical protein
MVHLNRRHALLGLAVASTLVPAGRAVAQSSGAPEGREIAPGVRRVEYTKRETAIPNYKTVLLRDTIYQPGASTSGVSMSNDMVCHMLEGELTVDTGSGTASTRRVTCGRAPKGCQNAAKIPAARLRSCA